MLYFKLNKFFNYDKSNKYVYSLAGFYFSVVEEFTKSIEFNHVLNVPPDFQIELMFLNIHLWFLSNRLNDFEQTPFLSALKTCLSNQLLNYVEEHITRLHINKKNEFVLDTKFYLENCQNFMAYHFKGNPKTLSNPLYKIDSLVWTTVFFEKVDRYDERVYLAASYILETYRYFQTLTLDDFKEFNVSFNVFRIPVKYKETIEKVNPPLSKAEFEEEKRKPDDLKKSFRYDYNEENVVLPIDEKVR